MKIGTHNFLKLSHKEVRALKRDGFGPNLKTTYFKCSKCDLIVYHNIGGEYKISDLHKKSVFEPESISCRDFIIESIIK